MERKVSIGNATVIAKLPRWCLFAGILCFLGAAFFLLLFAIWLLGSDSAGVDVVPVVTFGVLVAVFASLGLFLVRGGVKGMWLRVSFCRECHVVSNHYITQCPRCGKRVSTISVGGARPSYLSSTPSTGNVIEGPKFKKGRGNRQEGSRQQHTDVEFTDVFISHVEEDASIALEVAQCLEEAGFTTWYYERDSDPGTPYLAQIGEAIDRSKVVLLIVSPNSLDSYQVNSEVVHAFESDRPFIPVLLNITHDEFRRRQPVWRQALAAYTSIPIPPTGVRSISPKLIAGTKKILLKQWS